MNVTDLRALGHARGIVADGALVYAGEPRAGVPGAVDPREERRTR